MGKEDADFLINIVPDDTLAVRAVNSFLLIDVSIVLMFQGAILSICMFCACTLAVLSNCMNITSSYTHTT